MQLVPGGIRVGQTRGRISPWRSYINHCQSFECRAREYSIQPLSRFAVLRSNRTDGREWNSTRAPHGLHAYETLKEAAADYLDAQVELVVAAREVQDAGFTVSELHTSWLDTPPEEAVIEARVEADQEAARSEQVNDAVNKVLEALRSNGYEPALRIEDVEIHGTD